MDNYRRAVVQLARLPGVGEKTAQRYVYWLLRQPPEVARQMADALVILREGVAECSICRDLTDGNPCRRETTTPGRKACTTSSKARPCECAGLSGIGRLGGR